MYDRFCNLRSYAQAYRLWNILFDEYFKDVDFDIFSVLQRFEEGDVALFFIHDLDTTENIMESMSMLYDNLSRGPTL